MSDFTKEVKASLLEKLENRFVSNMQRHPASEWEDVLAKIEKKAEILQTLFQMEDTGGEPDVVILADQMYFIDCAPETPKGRRKICYDRPALEARKKNKPENDAHTVAEEIGIEILDETEYRALQAIEEFDLKTSTWIKTPSRIRELGGALYCDRRYDTVFTYHNSADSYYSSRGFRGKLAI